MIGSKGCTSKRISWSSKFRHWCSIGCGKSVNWNFQTVLFKGEKRRILVCTRCKTLFVTKNPSASKRRNYDLIEIKEEFKNGIRTAIPA